ncbi:dirigent protein 21 [Phtheirospermum japonicum]|uniref:Dirigent protein n=1 Tax=Phtheirospermum japonicum TaxID=374723 RepID=A0A830CJJ3_9LAMI|nr:dirigent protein 21 [Phtheirospermum japonicum]
MGRPKTNRLGGGRANITSKSTTSFGQVNVLDDLITAGRDRNSAKLGPGSGVRCFCRHAKPGPGMNIVFMFTAGSFNGSTLSVFGRKSLTSKDAQELQVVGGTGAFRMARGYSISNTISYDLGEKYGVLEYKVYLI